MQRALILILLLLCVPISAQTAPDSTFTESLRIGRGAVQHAGWHPDGERVLIDTVRGAWLYGVGDRQLVDLTHLPDIRLARFSADGTRIAGVDAEQNLTLFDAETYEQRATLPGHIGYVHELAWGAGDERIATLDHTGRLIVWDVQAQAVAFDHLMEDAEEFVWSPGGVHVALFRVQDGNINIFDAAGRMIFSNSPEDLYGYIYEYIWKNDTQILSLSISEITEATLWNLETFRTLTPPQISWSNAYSPDGSKFLAHSAFTSHILDAQTGELLFSFEGVPVDRTAWSPNSAWIALSSTRTDDRGHIYLASGNDGSIELSINLLEPVESIWWDTDGGAFLVVDRANQLHMYNVFWFFRISRGEQIFDWRSEQIALRS